MNGRPARDVVITKSGIHWPVYGHFKYAIRLQQRLVVVSFRDIEVICSEFSGQKFRADVTFTLDKNYSKNSAVIIGRDKANRKIASENISCLFAAQGHAVRVKEEEKEETDNDDGTDDVFGVHHNDAPQTPEKVVRRHKPSVRRWKFQPARYLRALLRWQMCRFSKL